MCIYTYIYINVFSMKFEAFPLPVWKSFQVRETARQRFGPPMECACAPWTGGGDFERQTMRTMREGFIWFLFGVAGWKMLKNPCWKKQFGDFFSDRTAQCTVDSQNPLWESFFYKAVNGRQRVLKPTHMFLAHKFAIRKHLNCRINGIFLIEIKATISHYGDLSLDVKGYNNIGCIQRWRIHPRTFNNSVPSGKLTVGPWKSPIFNGN